MLEITFISDYVCPYCYVGKELLLRAVRQTGINARIIYQPLEATEEPEPRVDTYHDPVRRERYKILDEPCKRLELNMKLPPNVIPRTAPGIVIVKKDCTGPAPSDSAA